MGPERSLAKLKERGDITVKLRQLEADSTKHRWAQRADAWDMEQERIRRETTQMDRIELDRKGLELANAMIEVAHGRVMQLRQQDDGIPIADLVKLADTGVKIQRLLMGEATSITEQKTETIEQYLERLRLSGKEPLWE